MNRSLHRRIVDAFWRVGLWGGYRVLKVYWYVRRPSIRGAGVFVVVGHQILLLRHSYKPCLGLPAGVVGRNEDLRVAAARELLEEVNLRVDPQALVHWGEVTDTVEFRTATTTFFRLDLDAMPLFSVDHREITSGEFRSLESLDPNELWPGVRQMLQARPLETIESRSQPMSARNEESPCS